MQKVAFTRVSEGGRVLTHPFTYPKLRSADPRNGLSARSRGRSIVEDRGRELVGGIDGVIGRQLVDS
jgi:hypothetical protein